MPQNVDYWQRLYGLAEKQMLADKEEISALKSKVNYWKQYARSLEAKINEKI